MRPTLFVVYEDIKTLKDNFSIKAVILSLLTVSFLPYIILGRFDGIGSQISNSVAVLLIMMQLLVPYLAMRMSYKSISGEIERNNHRLLLTFPISRFNLLIGKWISRSFATSVAVILHVLVSVLVSSVAYKSMNPRDVIWITLMTIVLGAVFCAIGVAISCITNSDSIIPDLLITVVYAPVVFFWRLIPVVLKFLIEGGSINNLPEADYTGLDYFILRLNPLESYSSLVSWGLSSDVNILIPSTLSLPNLEAQQIINYSSSPLKPASVPLYAQEVVTITLSFLIPILIMMYGYWKLKNKEF